jgi:hypothetical protein
MFGRAGAGDGFVSAFVRPLNYPFVGSGATG